MKKYNKIKVVPLFINNLFYLIIPFILIITINIILADNLNNENLNFINIIFLKVKGKNAQKIINSYYIPDLIYLNGFEIEYDEYIIIDNNIINNITLIWESKLDTLENVFESIENIIEVDLSKFDSSEITNMSGMFNGCINLQYINFNNINTSSVIDMS